MAAEMGTEINLQNGNSFKLYLVRKWKRKSSSSSSPEIIDDVADVMDQTNDRLIRNTRNIKKVDRKSNTCGKRQLNLILFIPYYLVLYTICTSKGHPSKKDAANYLHVLEFWTKSACTWWAAWKTVIWSNSVELLERDDTKIELKKKFKNN